MDFIKASLIDPISRVLWNYILIYLLVGAGLYFTIRTRCIQFRYFGRMLGTLVESRAGRADGISSFQAFCVGLASRVGTGNIAGVAIALTVGGPGAIFWMWVVGVFGMATAFVEATLAQLFKVPAGDRTFRGGPAYYIARGLRSRAGGAVFAVLLIVTFGIAFNMVQANTIADVIAGAHHVDARWTALALMLASAPILFGGVRRIARVAEIALPLMALVYLVLALVIVARNVGDLPTVIRDIVKSAFGLKASLAGTAGGFSAALLNGTKRGLFSNEAGMGSTPNAAATATVSHPVKQGLVQSFGVFVDTMVVCTATAFIILMSGVYPAGVTTSVTGASVTGASVTGATLTQTAVAHEFGSRSTWLMTVLIGVFAYTSLLGNYSYAEVNLNFLGTPPVCLHVFRGVVLAAVGAGSLLALTFVWEFADVAMAIMAIVNLTAILLLSRWAIGALRDYEQSVAASRDPVFRAANNQDMPDELPTEVW